MVDPFQLVAERYFAPAGGSMTAQEWARDKLGAYLWSEQIAILDSIRRYRYTAVHACHDSGKSYICAGAAVKHVDTHRVGEAMVVSTAPSAAQVSDILWREIGKMHRVGKFPGRIVDAGYPQWKIGQELVGYGRKPSDYSNTETQDAFQGQHSLYPLIILDEANGIPVTLFNAADSLATNEDARVVAIGNPDDPTSHFFSICQPGSGWNVIHIDGLRTPNFSRAGLQDFPLIRMFMEDNGIPYSTEVVPSIVQRSLLSPLWVQERMERWGVRRQVDADTGVVTWVQPSLWLAKVRGLFPESSTETVIPLGWVLAAQQRWHKWVADGRPGQPGIRVFGVDVAREGEDESAIATRQGQVIMDVESIGQVDTMALANRLLPKLVNSPRSMAVVDSVGVGGGVVDRLRELHQNVLPFSAGKATNATDITGEYRFANLRSAAWWKLREMLDPTRNPDLCLPPNDRLTIDLTTPRWKVVGTKIVIESKESIAKRIGRSTDQGDTVVQAMWVDGSPVHDTYGMTTSALYAQWGMSVDPLTADYDLAMAWQ